MEKLVRKIGLVAHDAMKKDLIEWVLWNSELLMGHKFYCTGTTGTLILEALREKHPDVEWDFTILKSGPLGGDQQMGSRIVDGEIDYLFFFTDPMTLQPHDTDVKALTRLAGVENIVFCCNRSTADHIISSPLFVDPTYERTVPDYSNYTKRFANKPVVAEEVEAGPQRLHQVQARQLRQAEVDHGHVEGHFAAQVQALVAVARGIDGESLTAQSRGQGLPQGGFVLDQ